MSAAPTSTIHRSIPESCVEGLHNNTRARLHCLQSRCSTQERDGVCSCVALAEDCLLRKASLPTLQATLCSSRPQASSELEITQVP